MHWNEVTELLKVLSGCLTPLIAILATYIAWQQYKTASDKLKLDLYDRRYRVYRGLLDFFAAAVREPRVPKEAFGTFFAVTHEGRFLFGKEIKDYLIEVREKISKLRQAQDRIDKLEEGTERDKAIETDVELLEWVDKQIDRAADKFKTYLAFANNL
jgi:hypothetical protein